MSYCPLDGSITLVYLREDYATVYRCPWCKQFTREELVEDGSPE